MTIPQSQRFTVQLTLLAAGPVKPRRKYREPEILIAKLCISQPFVPYPGLYLTMEPKKRGQRALYMRIRTVEWAIASESFECTVDEMLGALQFAETFEVRGGPRIEKHFLELERALRQFGFEFEMDMEAPRALYKHADGSRIVELKPWEREWE